MDLAELENCFGVFHSRKDARKALADIAKAKRLCLKVLGLEDAQGSCLAHQLGHCKGACVGKEPLVLHAVRVQMALSSLKFKSWPFPGRVALIERGPMGAVDSHVLDHWTYLGTARCEDELASLTRSRLPPSSMRRFTGSSCDTSRIIPSSNGRIWKPPRTAAAPMSIDGGA